MTTMTTESDTTFFTQNKITINKNTPFDDIEYVYHQMCRVILSNYIDLNIKNKYNYISHCIAHFPLTLIYLALPYDKREDIIKGLVALSIHNNAQLLKLNYDNLISHYSVNEYLQSCNIDISHDLIGFTSVQQSKLYTYFYELLYDYSIEAILLK